MSPSAGDFVCVTQFSRGAQYGRGTIYLAKEKLTKFQVLLKEVRYSSSGPPIGQPLLEAPGGAAAADAQGNEPDGAIGLLQGGRFGGAWVDAGQAVASNAIMLSGVAGEERFEKYPILFCRSREHQLVASRVGEFEVLNSDTAVR